MEPKSAKGRPKGGAENQVAKKTSKLLKDRTCWRPRADFERSWGGFGPHFGKNDFEGGPKIATLEAKST